VSGVAVPSEFVVVRERARPMAPEERRAAILDAVIPLLKERGRSVSTRQMADAAGVAEGTLFRAFGDKESIFSAATERYFDPEPLRNRLRAIDPDEPTEDKVRQIVALFVERFQGVIGFMSAMAIEPGPPPNAEQFRRSVWFEVIEQIFRPGELGVSHETFAFFIRLVAFGTAIPAFTSSHPFSSDELADLVLRGVLPTPPKKPSKG
jgi:AcrR family transcriptional regulator